MRPLRSEKFRSNGQVSAGRALPAVIGLLMTVIMPPAALTIVDGVRHAQHVGIGHDECGSPGLIGYYAGVADEMRERA